MRHEERIAVIGERAIELGRMYDTIEKGDDIDTLKDTVRREYKKEGYINGYLCADEFDTQIYEDFISRGIRELAEGRAEQSSLFNRLVDHTELTDAESKLQYILGVNMFEFDTETREQFTEGFELGFMFRGTHLGVLVSAGLD